MIDAAIVVSGKETDLNSRILREHFSLNWDLTYNLAGLICYGAFVRRNPFLAECLVRESMGYIAQALQILSKGKERGDASPQVREA